MKFPIEWEKLCYYVQHIFLYQTFFFSNDTLAVLCIVETLERRRYLAEKLNG